MQTLSQRIEQQLLDLGWSLWTELGVAGMQRQHQKCMIDLEALILLTSMLSESDPRLRDEALDWCSRYHQFVSVRRLKTLAKRLDMKAFSSFASTLNAISDSKWPVPVRMDPLKIKLSGKSQAPRCERAALLSLRLRALFGSGSRADLVTHFLTQETRAFSSADLTSIGYSKRNTSDVLNTLVSSGVLEARRVRNQQVYSLKNKGQMIKWVGALPRLAPNWIAWFRVLMTLRECVHEAENKAESIRVVSIANAMANLENELQELQLEFPSSTGNISTYWKAIEKWIQDITKELPDDQT